MRYLFLLLILLVMSCESEKQSSQGEAFLSNIDQVSYDIIDDSEKLAFFKGERRPVSTAFQNLPSGSTLPKGWLLDLMKNDLEKGIIGALDELYPGIKKDDLYKTARRGGLEDVPEMGDLVLTGAAWEKSIMWWNAETIGNWWDGFVRHAFMTNNEAAINQSHQIVDNLLSSQDEDGYIGIYKENLRYQHKGSNGELWAQTTAFRMLLAYYEFTDNAAVLEAVERAMALTIEKYGPNGRNPFYLENAFGGVTHGLMMTDVCESLARITGKTLYQDYATYLYQAFSTYSINRAFNDVRYPYLAEKDSLFTGHGVHTYEHLRTLINAYYHTGYPELEEAFENAMYKLDYCILPSGAGHGNEWIAGMKADPTITSTEFCTMLELRNFFTSAFQKTGSITFADQAEKLTFNAIMGARNEDGTAITYGKGDNCYVLDGHHHGHEGQQEEVRFKYSPTHSDPAVCCVPNYTRNFTYYLDQMWLKTEDGLVVGLYGPSDLSTSWNGTKVNILQETQYPFTDQIDFKITMEEPTDLVLHFRKPKWAKKLQLTVEGAEIEEGEDFIKVKKTWAQEEELSLTFEQQLQTKTLENGEVYVQRGPLVYAYPIPHEEETIKTYGETAFRDYYCLPLESNVEQLTLTAMPVAESFVTETLVEGKNPWIQKALKIRANGKLADQAKKIELVPMGGTILRKVSFLMEN